MDLVIFVGYKGEPRRTTVVFLRVLAVVLARMVSQVEGGRYVLGEGREL